MSRAPQLSIIIPARNEVDRIAPTLKSYHSYFDQHVDGTFELVVVVNNSNDGTLALVEELAVSHPALRTLHFEAAIGKGGAVHEGFAAAEGQIIGFVDADGATPPGAFADLVRHLRDKPSLGGAIASRWMPDSHVLTPQPLSRRVASRLFNRAVRGLFKLRFHDTQCGAKVFRREALIPLLARLENRGWLFDIELLIQLQGAGHRIEEVPTTWQDVEGSRFSMGRNLIPVLKDLLALRRRLRPFIGKS